MTDDRLATALFDYDLPAELIAQTPAPVRDRCRLLVVHRESGVLEDRHFFDLDEYLRDGDVLVANETRVRAARLIGRKRETGGAAEVLLLRPLATESDGAAKRDDATLWEALVKPGRRLKPSPDAFVDFPGDGTVTLSARIVDWAGGESDAKGMRIVELIPAPGLAVEEAIAAAGTEPLPPYIHDYQGERELYQTVYSRTVASAAAPTAGLHFTDGMIERLRDRGIEWRTVDLEVGIDTFRIVDEEFVDEHRIHTERYSISEETAAAVTRAKAEGRRVIAVGTTSVRALESAWNREERRLMPQTLAATSLYIVPGYRFGVVDGLITNFHVPRSTLMMLVSAFAGQARIRAAYDHAIAERYRFLSFGDAMLLI